MCIRDSFRAVLCPNRLHPRLLGIAQRDALKQTAAPAVPFSTHGATLLLRLRRGRLRLRDRPDRQDPRDGESYYSTVTHPSSEVLARSIARLPGKRCESLSVK